MKRKIVIEYWWECSRFKKIPKEYEEALKESAMSRITEMMQEGYTSGELCANIENGEDEFEFRGWWKVSQK